MAGGTTSATPSTAATPIRHQPAAAEGGGGDTPTSRRLAAEPAEGGAAAGRCVSVYRESLFVTLVALGQDNIDLTAFDRSVHKNCA
jgi:hypothetical protein